MTTRLRLYAALFGLATTTWHAQVNAGVADYRFEPVVAEVNNGDGATLAVRLVHVPTGQPVPGAIVFRSRLDMSPDDMAAMTAKHEPLPETELGIYRFKANLTMAGRWALKLMIRIQGEAETITGNVIFNAKE